MTYCTYLTIYSGNQLPPYYIGSTSIDKIDKGYKGSVRSKKYSKTWKEEIKTNPHLFDVIILTEHSTRIEALEQERTYQLQKDVVRNPNFINMSIAAPNGFFGMDLKGIPRKPFSDEWKANISKGQKGKTLSEEHKEKLRKPQSEEAKILISNSMKGRIFTEEHKEKLRKPKAEATRAKMKISNLPGTTTGKKWYHNPTTGKRKFFFENQEDEGFVIGKG